MRRTRLHTVVETPSYLLDAVRYLSEAERRAIVDHFAANPDSGVPIPGSGGARKLRWARQGGGKRGGVRIISVYSGPPVPVFLLALFAKGEKATMTKKELNHLKAELSTLLSEYRKGSRT